MRARITACLAAGLTVALAGAAHAGPTPTPPWLEPGEGTNAGTPRPINSQPPGTLQELRRPYTPVEETVEGGRKALSVSADVMFATGSAELTGTAQTFIEGLAGKLKEAGATGATQIVGHTDDVGEPAANQKLSQQRAEAVQQTMQPMVVNTGITLVAVGKGEAQPRARGITPEARAKNRRVAVLYGQAPSSTTPATPNTRDIHVPSTEAAPNPGLVQLPAEPKPIASTQRTIELPGYKWTVRLDVLELVRVGRFVKVGHRVRLVNQEGTQTLEYGALFTGDLFEREKHQSALIDKAAGEQLDPVITGKGWALRNYDDDVDLGAGVVQYGWALFPAPATSSGTLSLYVPAFGTIDGLRVG
ncbi:MAG: OmpA family protein [Actinomadura sp.]